MKNISIFCFGFGQVAKNFIKKINLEKFNVNLSVTSREVSKEKKIDEISYNNYQFTDENFDKNLLNKLKKSDHILISIPPVKGEDLVMTLGFSHEVKYKVPKGVKLKVEKQTKINIVGPDKELVAKTASEIKSIKPVEPYKGKGIKEKDQYVLRKEGKKK